MPGRLAPGSPIRVFIGNAVAFAPVLLLVSFFVWEFIKQPTPENARIVDPAATQQQASERQRTQSLCHQQALCRKFGEARQECATAGNYKNCLSIKMGDDAMDLYPCMNDGTAWGAPKDIPNRLTCFLSGVFQ
jgi:hypothetical protein